VDVVEGEDDAVNGGRRMAWRWASYEALVSLSIAVSLPPIRNARSVFLFFAAEVAWSKAIWVPWLASISFQRASYLVSLPALCALASAQHFSKDDYNLSAGCPDFLSSFSFFWPSSGRPADAATVGASGLHCSSLFLERVWRTFAHVEVLELLAVRVIAVHVERPPHLHREAGVITTQQSKVDGERE
jgi:hypothetical protein